MKIAFFSESYKPYLSGVTNSIETLFNELRSMGHDPYVFAPDYPDAKISENIYRLPSIGSPYPKYRLAIPRPFEVLKVLKEKGINIIHSHSPYQLGLMSMWCAGKLDLPFVFTMHTLFDKYMHYVPLIPAKLKEGFMREYIKGFSNRCDVIIVPTQKAKEYIGSTGVTSRIEVIPTGLDLRLFDKLDPRGVREKHGISQDCIVLLFVGRLAKEKNLPFLLRAFRLVQKEINNIKLLLVAGGPLESELKKEAADIGISEKTIFTGEIGYPEVLNYYAAADLFVFSSLTETQGLVLPEAMAAGLPVVALNSEGVSNIVKEGESGFLVEPSENLFAEKVIYLLLNKERLNELRISTKAYAASFSSKTFAGNIEKIYLSLPQ